MASGWAHDDVIQEQIDASIEDAVSHARDQLPTGDSTERCEECDAKIPQARQDALPGVRLCLSCQSELDIMN